MLGEQIDAGLLPNDIKLIGNMVADICYHNAAAQFSVKLPQEGK